MIWQAVIAHAPGEERLAEKIAQPLQEAGYGVSYRGTVLVGESFTEEASKALSAGGPVILCATINAMADPLSAFDAVIVREQARFARMDKNGDGVITADEMGARGSRGLMEADTDHDGKISRAEFMTQSRATRWARRPTPSTRRSSPARNRQG